MDAERCASVGIIYKIFLIKNNLSFENRIGTGLIP